MIFEDDAHTMIPRLRLENVRMAQIINLDLRIEFDDSPVIYLNYRSKGMSGLKHDMNKLDGITRSKQRR